MKLNEKQIKSLKPCIKSATLTGKKVYVVCADNASGKLALSILQTVYNPKSTQLIGSYAEWWAFWGIGWRYRDFYLKFNTEEEAIQCANDLTDVIAEAIAGGNYNQGAGSLEQSLFGKSETFFQSNFFYAMLSIVVVVILATIGIKMVQAKK